MTDLSTSNLKRLLDAATPGPWRISLTEGISGLGFAEDFYQDDPREKANVTLAAAAPDLAQEVLRLRAGVEQLLGMCLRERDAAFQDTPVRAGAVVAFGVCAERLTNLLNGDTE